MKQKMTITEAQKAVNEIVNSVWIGKAKVANEKDFKHKQKLKKALNDLDLHELDAVLNEGKDG